ncbi:MAG: hypothetical protein JSU63_10060, partial [Phycisphaerales bacterium]
IIQVSLRLANIKHVRNVLLCTPAISVESRRLYGVVVLFGPNPDETIPGVVFVDEVAVIDEIAGP